MATDVTSLEVDSREWKQLIRRRADLIFKKNRQGLNDAERIEYEQLEKIVDKVMSR